MCNGDPDFNNHWIAAGKDRDGFSEIIERAAQFTIPANAQLDVDGDCWAIVARCAALRYEINSGRPNWHAAIKHLALVARVLCRRRFARTAPWLAFLKEGVSCGLATASPMFAISGRSFLTPE